MIAFSGLVAVEGNCAPVATPFLASSERASMPEMSTLVLSGDFYCWEGTRLREAALPSLRIKSAVSIEGSSEVRIAIQNVEEEKSPTKDTVVLLPSPLHAIGTSQRQSLAANGQGESELEIIASLDGMLHQHLDVQRFIAAIILPDLRVTADQPTSEARRSFPLSLGGRRGALQVFWKQSPPANHLENRPGTTITEVRSRFVERQDEEPTAQLVGEGRLVRRSDRFSPVEKRETFVFVLASHSEESWWPDECRYVFHYSLVGE